jgi:hypothetical protein
MGQQYSIIVPLLRQKTSRRHKAIPLAEQLSIANSGTLDIYFVYNLAVEADLAFYSSVVRFLEADYTAITKPACYSKSGTNQPVRFPSV